MLGQTKNYTSLAQDNEDLKSRRNTKQIAIKWIPTAIAFLIIFYVATANASALGTLTSKIFGVINTPKSEPACPQYPTLGPSTSKNEQFEKLVDKIFESDTFFDWSLRNMQGAVGIATESFDDMGLVGEDERWGIFYDFHRFLEKRFPLV
jgi:hypothetical protein